MVSWSDPKISRCQLYNYNPVHKILELCNTLEKFQVKQCLISNIKDIVYKLPYELPNNLSLKILGNVRNILKFGGYKAFWPVFFAEIKCL